MANSSVRQRKGQKEKEQPRNEPDTKKDQKEEGQVDLEPNFWVAATIMLCVGAALGLFFYYRVDGANGGPFAAFIDANLLPKNRYQ